MLRPAIQSIPFAVNDGTPDRKIEPTSDSSDDEAVPLDIEDNVSGDDEDDDAELQALDEGDAVTDQSLALLVSLPGSSTDPAASLTRTAGNVSSPLDFRASYGSGMGSDLSISERRISATSRAR